MSLSSCLKQAGNALDQSDKVAIVNRSRALRAKGLTPTQAAVQAVDERLQAIQSELGVAEAAPPAVEPKTPRLSGTERAEREYFTAVENLARVKAKAAAAKAPPGSRVATALSEELMTAENAVSNTKKLYIARQDKKRSAPTTEPEPSPAIAAMAAPAAPPAAPDAAPTPKIEKLTFKPQADALRERLKEAAKNKSFTDDFREEAKDFADALNDSKLTVDEFKKLIAAGERLLGLDGNRYANSRGDNPDKAPKLSAKLKSFLKARGAARWLAVNAADPMHRQIAARIVGALGDSVTLHYSDGTTDVPDDVVDTFAEKPGVAAVAYRPANSSNVMVFFRKGYEPDETMLLHELVHAATMIGVAADPELAARLDMLAEDVRRQLGRMPGSDAAFFRGVVVNGDELLAYGFTSPTFHKMLKDISARMKTTRTLWQRFIDAVLSALGWGTSRPDLMAQLEELFEAAMASNSYATRRASSQVLTGTEKPTDEQNVEAGRFHLPDPPANGKMTVINAVRAGIADWRNVPGVLGWLSLRQLAERFNESPLVERYTSAALRMGQRAEQIMGEANQSLTVWRNLPGDAQRALGKVMLEATMARAHVDAPWMDKRNDHLRSPGDTFGVAQNKKEYDRIRALYDALPQRAKDIYAKARDTMAKQWADIAEARINQILRAFEPDLKSYFTKAELQAVVVAPKAMRESLKETAKYASMPLSARRALRSLIDSAEAHYDEVQSMKGPYFPLVRFGDHVVVAKSATFREAQAAYEKERDALQALYDADAPATESEEVTFDAEAKAARAAVAKAKALLDDLKDSDRHYAVTFFEHRWEAENYLKQLKTDPVVEKFGLQLALQQRARHHREFDSASPQFVRQIEEQLRSALPKADVGAVQNAVREIYLRSLPDRSAMKSELRRLNVAGAKATEMMRGYATRSMSNAHRISRMEYSGEMQEALQEMRKSENRDEMLVGEELALRLAKSIVPVKRSAVFETLAQAAHLTFLGMSPSYVLINAAQPWAISLPIMASRHGWSAAGRALIDAEMEVFSQVKALRKVEADKLAENDIPLAQLRSFRFDIQPEQLGKTDAERQMLRALFNDGLINITIEHDIGAVSGNSTKNWFDIASEAASTPAHLVEVVNRVATSLAAFRLQQRKDVADNSYESAVLYATQVVGDTHLDYSAENAPRLMRPETLGGLGRLVFQFKKYMQGMIYLQGKLLKAAAQGDREALKGFAYLNGMTLALAGTSGLPVAGGVGLLFKALSNLWDDDDEPDLGLMMYNGMRDVLGDTAARAIAKGLPAAAGADLSKRAGMSSLTNPGEFVDTSKTGRELYMSLLMGFAGPSSAMLANWFDASSVAATDPMRAAQLVLPKALSDPLKALERADTGIVSRAGATLVASEELSAAQNVLKSLGLESTPVVEMYENRGAVNLAKKKQDEVRSRLIRNYVEARRANEPVSDIMADIAAFNRRNPAARVTPATLASSVRSRRDDAKLMQNGAIVRKRDRDVLDQVGL